MKATAIQDLKRKLRVGTYILVREEHMWAGRKRQGIEREFLLGRVVRHHKNTFEWQLLKVLGVENPLPGTQGISATGDGGGGYAWDYATEETKAGWLKVANLPRLLAAEFSEVLASRVTRTQMEQIRRRNRTGRSVAGCCASHDFCDANMAMEQAFKNLGLESGDDAESTEFWNKAWGIAKKTGFTLRSVRKDPFGGVPIRYPIREDERISAPKPAKARGRAK